tara:strand:+ start:85 stop:336 length:252 start_codon:yes stop_codon:yes gene_type:complete
MNFSKTPVNNIKLNIPLNMPIIKPKIILIVLYDEILPSNRNSNKLVNSLNIIRDIVKIIPIEKKIIIVGLIEIYLEIKNDKST